MGAGVEGAARGGVDLEVGMADLEERGQVRAVGEGCAGGSTRWGRSSSELTSWPGRGSWRGEGLAVIV